LTRDDRRTGTEQSRVGTGCEAREKEGKHQASADAFSVEQRLASAHRSYLAVTQNNSEAQDIT
jgi:hypothetical protein